MIFMFFTELCQIHENYINIFLPWSFIQTFKYCIHAPLWICVHILLHYRQKILLETMLLTTPVHICSKIPYFVCVGPRPRYFVFLFFIFIRWTIGCSIVWADTVIRTGTQLQCLELPLESMLGKAPRHLNGSLDSLNFLESPSRNFKWKLFRCKQRSWIIKERRNRFIYNCEENILQVIYDISLLERMSNMFPVYVGTKRLQFIVKGNNITKIMLD